MRIILILASIILIVTSCAGLQSSTIQINNLQLLDYGLLNINVKKTIDKSTTASGKHNVVDEMEFYKKTTDISPKMKDTFGIKYQVNGIPQGKIAEFTFMVLHPPIKGRTTSSANVKATIGSWRADFYTFDEEYELVEGEWKMQIWDKDQMLLEKTFTIKKLK